MLIGENTMLPPPWASCLYAASANWLKSFGTADSAAVSGTVKSKAASGRSTIRLHLDYSANRATLSNYTPATLRSRDGELRSVSIPSRDGELRPVSLPSRNGEPHSASLPCRNGEPRPLWRRWLSPPPARRPHR